MWITQTAYLELQKALIGAQAEVAAIKAQQAALTNTNDWLMVRVTQLEMERAKLIEVNYGVKVDVPVIEKRPEHFVTGMTTGQPKLDSDFSLNQTISFNDVGDDEARRLGISWNDNGEVVYGTYAAK